MEVLHTPNGKFVNLIFIKHVYALAFNQYILTEMDNESINFAIDAANSVLFQIATDNNCNKVVRYGHKNVKFYEGRKLILLVQIIRCTVIQEDHTEEQHYHELLPDILLPFLQYTAASFAILKYSSDKAANMAEQDKPIWCRVNSNRIFQNCGLNQGKTDEFKGHRGQKEKN